jgi:hypothetical protein
MIHPTVSCDLTGAMLEAAIKTLISVTGEGPLGLIAGTQDASVAEELITELKKEHDGGAILSPHFSIAVLEGFPRDAWMVYNHKDVWYSPGA